jgi:hypothetical protein
MHIMSTQRISHLYGIVNRLIRFLEPPSGDQSFYIIYKQYFISKLSAEIRQKSVKSSGG